MVFLSLRLHALLSPFDSLCYGMAFFLCKFTIKLPHKSKHQLLVNTAYSLIVQAPSNAELFYIFTIVPNAEVIMSASGLLERPKSATFAAHLLFFLTMNTLRDFKSLWITGGSMKWRTSMPLAIYKAIEIL